MKPARSLVLTLAFSADLHHGSGDGIAGIVDRALLRDVQGIPYLSGAALKGKLRYGMLRWLRSLDEPVCDPDNGAFCPEGSACAMCRVFGSPRRRGRLAFFDAYPEQRVWLGYLADSSRSAVLSGPTTVRTHAAVNRSTRTVERGHLYTTETLKEGIRFTSRIVGAADSVEIDLLKKSACLLTCFGAGSARGLGFCRYEIGEVS